MSRKLDENILLRLHPKKIRYVTLLLILCYERNKKERADNPPLHPRTAARGVNAQRGASIKGGTEKQEEWEKYDPGHQRAWV